MLLKGCCVPLAFGERPCHGLAIAVFDPFLPLTGTVGGSYSRHVCRWRLCRSVPLFFRRFVDVSRCSAWRAEPARIACAIIRFQHRSSLGPLGCRQVLAKKARSRCRSIARHPGSPRNSDSRHASEDQPWQNHPFMMFRNGSLKVGIFCRPAGSEISCHPPAVSLFSELAAISPVCSAEMPPADSTFFSG